MENLGELSSLDYEQYLGIAPNENSTHINPQYGISSQRPFGNFVFVNNPLDVHILSNTSSSLETPTNLYGYHPIIQNSEPTLSSLGFSSSRPPLTLSHIQPIYDFAPNHGRSDLTPNSDTVPLSILGQDYLALPSDRLDGLSLMPHGPISTAASVPIFLDADLTSKLADEERINMDLTVHFRLFGVFPGAKSPMMHADESNLSEGRRKRKIAQITPEWISEGNLKATVSQI